MKRALAASLSAAALCVFVSAMPASATAAGASATGSTTGGTGTAGSSVGTTGGGTGHGGLFGWYYWRRRIRGRPEHISGSDRVGADERKRWENSTARVPPPPAPALTAPPLSRRT